MKLTVEKALFTLLAAANVASTAFAAPAQADSTRRVDITRTRYSATARGSSGSPRWRRARYHARPSLGAFELHNLGGAWPPGETFDTAPDALWVRWQLLAAGEPAYQSGCVQVDLDP